IGRGEKGGWSDRSAANVRARGAWVECRAKAWNPDTRAGACGARDRGARGVRDPPLALRRVRVPARAPRRVRVVFFAMAASREIGREHILLVACPQRAAALRRATSSHIQRATASGELASPPAVARTFA